MGIAFCSRAGRQTRSNPQEAITQAQLSAGKAHLAHNMLPDVAELERGQWLLQHLCCTQFDALPYVVCAGGILCREDDRQAGCCCQQLLLRLPHAAQAFCLGNTQFDAISLLLRPHTPAEPTAGQGWSGCSWCSEQSILFMLYMWLQVLCRIQQDIAIVTSAAAVHPV